jgi:hypothetical protein
LILSITTPYYKSLIDDFGDDTQLIDGVRPADICLSIARLEQGIEEIHRWCASRRLQLNPSKTEVIWFGTTGTLKKIRDSDLTLRVGSDVIEPANVLRDLGLLLDQELSMKHYVNKVATSCFFNYDD